MRKKKNRICLSLMALVLCLVFVIAPAAADGEVLVQFPVSSDGGAFGDSLTMQSWYEAGRGDTPDRPFFSVRGVNITSSYNVPLQTGGWADRFAIYIEIFPQVVSVGTNTSSVNFKDFLSYLYGKPYYELESEENPYAVADEAHFTVFLHIYEISGGKETSVPVPSFVIAKKNGSVTTTAANNAVLLYNLELDKKYRVELKIWGSRDHGTTKDEVVFPVAGVSGGGKINEHGWYVMEEFSTVPETDTSDGANRIVKMYSYTLERKDKNGNTIDQSRGLRGSLSLSDYAYPVESSLSFYKKNVATHSVPKIRVMNGPSTEKFDFSDGRSPMDIINGKVSTRPDSDSAANTLASWFKFIRLCAITLCIPGMIFAVIRIANPSISGFALFRLREALSGWVLLLFIIGASTFILSFLVQVLFQ